jgi:hypothetical protein
MVFDSMSKTAWKRAVAFGLILVASSSARVTARASRACRYAESTAGNERSWAAAPDGTAATSATFVIEAAVSTL